jgi:1-deoxy-D-xylulose-5-phosphate synthase
VIRYPKNAAAPDPEYPSVPFSFGQWNTLKPGNQAVILAVGSMTGVALAAAKQLKEAGLEIEVINASTVKPLDTACLRRLAKRKLPVFSLEEHVLDGGFGSALLEYSADTDLALKIHPLAVRNQFVTHGDHEILLKEIGLDPDAVVVRILDQLQKSGKSDE